MSKFEEGFQEKWNPLSVNDAWATVMEKDFPNLVSAIAGNILWKPGDKGLPPLTLMIFAKDGNLRFSLSAREYSRSFFGVVTDPDAVLKSIETAISECKGEWVTKRK